MLGYKSSETLPICWICKFILWTHWVHPSTKCGINTPNTKSTLAIDVKEKKKSWVKKNEMTNECVNIQLSCHPLNLMYSISSQSVICKVIWQGEKVTLTSIEKKEDENTCIPQTLFEASFRRLLTSSGSPVHDFQLILLAKHMSMCPIECQVMRWQMTIWRSLKEKWRNDLWCKD